jgi:hypothetical protein
MFHGPPSDRMTDGSLSIEMATVESTMVENFLEIGHHNHCRQTLTDSPRWLCSTDQLSEATRTGGSMSLIGTSIN